MNKRYQMESDIIKFIMCHTNNKYTQHDIRHLVSNILDDIDLNCLSSNLFFVDSFAKEIIKSCNL